MLVGYDSSLKIGVEAEYERVSGQYGNDWWGVNNIASVTSHGGCPEQ